MFIYFIHFLVFVILKIEEQHKKALEEDPSVFDYDGVYDEMKEKTVRHKLLVRENRQVC